MEVCTVCGALLVVGDVQQRIDEHLMGKQHAGYARIRAFVEAEKQVRYRDISLPCEEYIRMFVLWFKEIKFPMTLN